MPFYTIVIPLYNKEHFIAETLRGVLAQTFADYEVIVVNDGSTDGSEAIVRQFTDPRIQYYLRENKGVSAARNFGITMAKGQYIIFLDADDYWYPDFLQTMYRNIQRFPKHHVFTAAIEIETAKNIIPAEYGIVRNHPVEIVDFFEASGKECVIFTSAAVFHKNVFDRSGVFDTAMRSGQDTDLWMRIGLNHPVVFDWKVLVRYTFDPASLSRNRNFLASKINFDKFADHEKTNPDLKRFLDHNRFSLAIKSKINGDDATFAKLKTAIDKRNMSLKRSVLLQMPTPALQTLLRINRWLAENGLSNSVFR